MLPHIVTDGAVTVFVGGSPKTVDSTHPNYSLVLDALKHEDWDEIEELVDIPTSIIRYTNGVVDVVDGEVFYQGVPTNNVVSRKIIELMENGYPFEYLANFLAKVQANPSNSSVEELYLFLEDNDMTIFPDGDFLAYKKVNNNYTDKHTGQVDNRVGRRVTMPRNKVDDRRNVTCSHGLHFASYNYAKGFGSGRLMGLKINPADVVSIPNEYRNQKGRCAGYYVWTEVQEELKGPVVDDHFVDVDFIVNDDNEFLDGEDYYNYYGSYNI